MNKKIFKLCTLSISIILVSSMHQMQARSTPRVIGGAALMGWFGFASYEFITAISASDVEIAYYVEQAFKRKSQEDPSYVMPKFIPRDPKDLASLARKIWAGVVGVCYAPLIIFGGYLVKQGLEN